MIFDVGIHFIVSTIIPLKFSSLSIKFVIFSFNFNRIITFLHFSFLLQFEMAWKFAYFDVELLYFYALCDFLRLYE